MALTPEQQAIWPQVLTEAERLLDEGEPCDSWTIADNLVSRVVSLLLVG